MTSTAQTSANQQNAQFSTGPRTEQGKATSSQNGISHALSSGFTLLPHESQADLDTLSGALIADFQPQNHHESFLVDRMIEARWRIVRTNRLEGAPFDYILEGDSPNPSPDARIVAHMSKKGADVIAVLQRYAAAAERSYQQNYRELLRGRQANQKMEIKAMDNYIKNVVFAPLPTQPPSDPAPTPPQNGFASQNAQKAQTAAPFGKQAAPANL